MLESDRSRFFALLGGVHDFYGKELSKFAGDVWWRCCSGSDYETVSLAFSHHLADPERGQWMPKPADLVRQLEGTQSDRSRRAWGKVLEAAQRVGAYRSVTFDEPAIHAAIEDVGGWMLLCRTEADELPHLERRFCASYRAYLAPGKLTQWPPVLLGESELNNRLHGYGGCKPVLIGDEAQARAVFEAGIAGPRTQITTVSEALKRITV